MKAQRNDKVFNSLYQKIARCCIFFFNDKSLLNNYGDTGRILKFS